MTSIVKPAIPILPAKKREARALYFTTFPVSDFVPNEFYQVKELDPKDRSGTQRILEMKRAKSLAFDMMDARKANHAFLPTSILLATDTKVEYDSKKGMISFPPEAMPFQVVDGQHRIEGMRIAAQKTPALADFPLAVVLATGLDKLEQKLQFLLVNTRQKPVDQSIVVHLKAHLTEKMPEIGEKNIFMPRGIRREVDRKATLNAMNFARYLNGEEDSPWYQRIRLANQGRVPRTTITAYAFTNLVKKHLLVDDHPLYNRDPDMTEKMRHRMLLNYWKAVEAVYVKKVEKSVVFKYNGVAFFHMVALAMFDWLYLTKERGVKPKRIMECFEQANKQLLKQPEEDYHQLVNPNWWQDTPRKGANLLGMPLIRKYAGALTKAIWKARQAELGETPL